MECVANSVESRSGSGFSGLLRYACQAWEKRFPSSLRGALAE
jgi:hypothetical protein